MQSTVRVSSTKGAFNRLIIHGNNKDYSSTKCYTDHSGLGVRMLGFYYWSCSFQLREFEKAV